jgi:hypothetical protein
MRTPLSWALAWLAAGILTVCCARGLIGLWLEAGSTAASRHVATEAAFTASRTLCDKKELHGFVKQEAKGNIGKPFVVFVRDIVGELRANFFEAGRGITIRVRDSHRSARNCHAEKKLNDLDCGESQPFRWNGGKQRVQSRGSELRYP